MLGAPTMFEPTQTTRALGCEVHALSLAEARDVVLGWLDGIGADNQHLLPCRYVVTPNLDHAVLLRSSEPLRAAYEEASLVLADGMPLVWAAKMFRRALPERVAGSDLGPAVMEGAESGTRVFLLGASEESSKRAAEVVSERYPQLVVAGRMSPPMGFEKDPEWSEKIVSAIRESKATLVLVGFGAPKQELWVHAHHKQLPGTVVLCIGATIDFLSGSVKRAPAWAQKMGAEWIHRLLSDPGRLAKRYGKDAVYLPSLLVRDAMALRKR